MFLGIHHLAWQAIALHTFSAVCPLYSDKYVIAPHHFSLSGLPRKHRHYTIKMLNISPYWPQVHQISLQFCCKHKIEQSTKSTCTLTRPWGLADSSFSFSTNLGPSSWNWLWRKHTSTLFIVKQQTGSSQQKWTKPTDRWTQMNKSKARFPKV